MVSFFDRPSRKRRIPQNRLVERVWPSIDYIPSLTEATGTILANGFLGQPLPPIQMIREESQVVQAGWYHMKSGGHGYEIAFRLNETEGISPGEWLKIAPADTASSPKESRLFDLSYAATSFLADVVYGTEYQLAEQLLIRRLGSQNEHPAILTPHFGSSIEALVPEDRITPSELSAAVGRAYQQSLMLLVRGILVVDHNSGNILIPESEAGELQPDKTMHIDFTNTGADFTEKRYNLQGIKGTVVSRFRELLAGISRLGIDARVDFNGLENDDALYEVRQMLADNIVEPLVPAKSS